MMKKIVCSLAFVAGIFTTAFSQFSDQGFADLKLGTPLDEVKSRYSFSMDEYNNGTMRVNGVDLAFTFAYARGSERLLLYNLSNEGHIAIVDGNPTNLIGLTRTELYDILGDKLEVDEGDNEFERYLIYYKDAKARRNKLTRCLIELDENDIVISVSACHYH